MDMHMTTLVNTHLADELDVFPLNVPHHQDLHLGQEMQGHLIHSVSKHTIQTQYYQTLFK